MRVLVTGASGFLGHAVCGELRRRGHEVSALVRRPGSEPEGCQAVVGDITDRAGLSAALEPVPPDCLVHLAAEIASQRDAEKIALVNVRGTQFLIEALAERGRPRFVLASTVVTGDAHGDELHEGSELPVETAYGRSKQECERLVEASGLDHAIVRPSHVYGPGGWFEEEFVKRLRQPGRFAVVGKGDNWWDVVHSDDVAAAFALAAEDDSSSGTYHVVDDEPIRYFDFVALAAEALGVGGPRRIPAWLAVRVAGRDPVAAVTRSAKSSNAHIKEALGWEPRWPTAREGVPDAVARLA